MSLCCRHSFFIHTKGVDGSLVLLHISALEFKAKAGILSTVSFLCLHFFLEHLLRIICEWDYLFRWFSFCDFHTIVIEKMRVQEAYLLSDLSICSFRTLPLCGVFIKTHWNSEHFYLHLQHEQVCAWCVRGGAPKLTGKEFTLHMQGV